MATAKQIKSAIGKRTAFNNKYLKNVAGVTDALISANAARKEYEFDERESEKRFNTLASALELGSSLSESLEQRKEIRSNIEFLESSLKEKGKELTYLDQKSSDKLSLLDVFSDDVTISDYFQSKKSNQRYAIDGKMLPSNYTRDDLSSMGALLKKEGKVDILEEFLDYGLSDDEKQSKTSVTTTSKSVNDGLPTTSPVTEGGSPLDLHKSFSDDAKNYLNRLESMQVASKSELGAKTHTDETQKKGDEIPGKKTEEIDKIGPGLDGIEIISKEETFSNFKEKVGDFEETFREKWSRQGTEIKEGKREDKGFRVKPDTIAHKEYSPSIDNLSYYEKALTKISHDVGSSIAAGTSSGNRDLRGLVDKQNEGIQLLKDALQTMPRTKEFSELRKMYEERLEKFQSDWYRHGQLERLSKLNKHAEKNSKTEEFKTLDSHFRDAVRRGLVSERREPIIGPMQNHLQSDDSSYGVSDFLSSIGSFYSPQYKLADYLGDFYKKRSETD